MNLPFLLSFTCYYKYLMFSFSAKAFINHSSQLGEDCFEYIFMLSLSLKEFYSEISFSLLFLTFCVSEGCLRLSILVSIVRSHENDYLGSLVLLQC